jgi:hypothetical protein
MLILDLELKPGRVYKKIEVIKNLADPVKNPVANNLIP